MLTSYHGVCCKRASRARLAVRSGHTSVAVKALRGCKRVRHAQRQDMECEQNGSAPASVAPYLPGTQADVRVGSAADEMLHQRYITLFNRRVQFHVEATGEVKEVLFDVAGHPQCHFKCAVTFPFHPHPDGRKGGEVTIVREYAQGPNAMMYCLPTGGFDPKKHRTLEDTSRAELSEEALLQGGQLLRLLPEGHAGFPEMKWCLNRFTPFLVIAPTQDPAPGTRDDEEFTVQVLRVPIDEFEQKLLLSGDVLLPSVTTSILALQRLRSLGLI